MKHLMQYQYNNVEYVIVDRCNAAFFFCSLHRPFQNITYNNKFSSIVCSMHLLSIRPVHAVHVLQQHPNEPKSRTKQPRLYQPDDRQYYGVKHSTSIEWLCHGIMEHSYFDFQFKVAKYVLQRITPLYIPALIHRSFFTFVAKCNPFAMQSNRYTIRVRAYSNIS